MPILSQPALTNALRAMRDGGSADGSVSLACIARLTKQRKAYLAEFVEPRLNDTRYLMGCDLAEEFFAHPPHRDLTFDVVGRGNGFDKNVVKVFLADWNRTLTVSVRDIEIVSGLFSRIPKDAGYRLGRRNSYRAGGWPKPPRVPVEQKIVTY